MSQSNVCRTVPLPVTVVLTDGVQRTLTSTDIPGFPSGGIIVGWDVANVTTTTSTIWARVSATPITLPGTDPGNAVLLTSGGRYAFIRDEGIFNTEDSTFWGSLRVLSSGGAYTCCAVATVLLPPGVSA